MLDPFNPTYYPLASTSQGFDGMIGVVTKSTCSVPYSAALNRHPDVSGAISIASGASHCYLQSLRKAGAVAGTYQSVQEYVPLYILPYAIAADEYPPAMSNAGSGEVIRKSQVNYGVLRNLTKPTGARDVATALSWVADIYPHLGWIADPFRGFHNSANVKAVDGYSAYLGRDHAKVVASLHWAASNAAKDPAIDWVVKTAISIYGTYQRGWIGGRGAGQWHGYHEILYAAAFLLGHSGMLAAAQAMQSNMVSPFGYVDAGAVAKSAAFPDIYVYNRPFFTEEIGKPYYFGDGVGGDVSRRYATICTPATVEALGPVLALQNGPGGISGGAAILQGSMSPSNLKSAALAYCDRFRNFQPNLFANENTPEELETWDAFRDLHTADPKWTGRPDQINAQRSTIRFTGAAGAINWDYAGFDWASEVVTNRRVMVSLDGILGPVTTGAALTGSITTGLLLGVPHYCQIAQDSASGTGMWSANYPYDYNDPERNIATPTGTVANAAPSYAGRVTPRIMVPDKPSWAGPSWVENAAPNNTVVKYKCAVGYPSGFPAPAYPGGFVPQWKLDGVNVGPATLEYNRDFLTGGVLTCELTVTTTSGSVVYTTPGITITAIAADPATTLIDTTFGPDFALKYASINAAIVTSGGTKVLLPYQEFGADSQPDNDTVPPYDVSSLTDGAIWLDKTGTQPRLYIPIPGCVSGKTYRVITTVAPNYGNQVFPNSVYWAVDQLFQIERTMAGTDYHNVTLSKGVNRQIYALTVDRTFTADHTGTLWCSYANPTGTGGTSGGDIYVASLSVKEA